MKKEQISEKEIEKVSGGAISKSKFGNPRWEMTRVVHAVCMKCGKRITRTYHCGGILQEEHSPGEVRCDECRKKEWEKRFPGMTKVGSEETK